MRKPVVYEVLLLAVLLLAVLFVVGCGNPTKPVDNAKASPGLEFGLLLETPEGVKVYRFYDSGRYHYIAVDRDGRSSLEGHK